MKNIMGKILLTILLIMPIVVSASTYDSEVNKANNLLNKENYVHTYEKYIVHGNNIKFEYSENENKVNTSFLRGGFISLEEYNLSRKNDVSYLFEGIEFWTLSRNGNNVYAITYADTNTPKNPELSYSGRATEFVNPNVTIKGKGTLSNPWTFDAMFKVSAVVDNRYATIESGNNTYVRGGCTNTDCTAKIVITPKSGFRYIANDCNGQYDEANHILSVNNVKRDTKCNVSFGKGLFTVALTGGTPNKIYLKHGENFYKESSTKTIIRKIDSVSPRTGYTFIGYFYNGRKIINGLKETQIDDNLKIPYESVTGKYITSDVTLEPTYEANQYKVIFNCNGGSNPPTTQLIIYDQQFTITSSVCQRAGYIQPSWNTKADGTGETWTVANHTDVKWQISHDVTLYAVWNICPAGTYSPASSNTCTECSIGYYSANEGSATCTGCSAGTYTGSKGKTSCTTCQDGYYCPGSQDRVACAAGKEGTGTGKTSETEGCSACKDGYYSTSAGTATCTGCAAGKEGTGTGKTSEAEGCSLCKDGYYSTSAGTAACTGCAAGKEGTGTGKTSESAGCSLCKDGYYSTSVGTAACTACAAGKEGTGTGKTSESAGCSLCAKGTYSTSAGTATCSTCPTGYPDTANTGSTLKTQCRKGTTCTKTNADHDGCTVSGTYNSYTACSRTNCNHTGCSASGTYYDYSSCSTSNCNHDGCSVSGTWNTYYLCNRDNCSSYSSCTCIWGTNGGTCGYDTSYDCPSGYNASACQAPNPSGSATSGYATCRTNTGVTVMGGCTKTPRRCITSAQGTYVGKTDSCTKSDANHDGCSCSGSYVSSSGSCSTSNAGSHTECSCSGSYVSSTPSCTRSDANHDGCSVSGTWYTYCPN